MATELAVAYVSLVPSARGISGAIQSELSGPTNAAAQTAGAAAGRSFGSRFSGSLNNIVVPRELERSFTRVGTSADGTGESFKRVGTGARQAVRSARGLGNTLTGLQDTSQGVSQIMQGDLLGGLISLHSGFIDLAAGVAKTATTIGRATVSIVVSVARTVAANAVAVASVVAGWILMGAQSLLAAAKIALAWLISLGPIAIVIAVVAGVVALIIMYWDEIKAAIVAAATFVLNFIRDNWRLLIVLITGPIGIAVALIVTHWDTIKGAISAAVNFVIGFVRDHWQLILAILTGPIGLAVLFITQNWDTIVGIFRATVEFVLGIWQAGWDAVWAVVQAAWQTLSGFFTALPGAVAGFFVSAASWLVEGGRNILRGLSSGILEIWASVTTWFGEMPGTLVGYFWNALSWLYNGGKNIITGLWDGIKQIWGDVTGWFAGIPDKILSALNIASPPQWAIRAGKDIMQGIVIGAGSGGGLLDKIFAAHGFGGIAGVASRLAGMFGDRSGGGGGSAAGLVGFAREARLLFGNMFPWMTIGGWRATGSVPGSDHPKGKALDLMTRDGFVAQQIISAFRQLAGAKYWIWNRQIATAAGGWTPRSYSGPSPHTDHVHLSFFGSGGVLPYTGLFGGHRGEVIFTPDQMRVLGSVIGRDAAGGGRDRADGRGVLIEQNNYGITDVAELARRSAAELAWTMRVAG